MKNDHCCLLAALTCAGCTLSPPADPSAPTISANRPSFSDGTALVPPGHLQLETGYTFTRRNRSGTTTERQAAPEILARYRLLDRLEGQLLFGGYQFQHTSTGGAASDADGASDLGFGVRIPIEPQHGLMPTLALGGSATFGTGADAFSTGAHAVPTGKILWSYDIDGGFGLGGNFVLAYPDDGEQRFAQSAASVCASCAIDRFTLFGEYFVVTPYANHTGPAHSLDAGLLYLVSRCVQVDARVGFGLDDEADDFFTGAGISFLF